MEKPSVEKPEVKEETKEEKSPSQNIFGAAKPVDTASRERQIESRLEKERELKTDTKAGGDTKENDRKFKKTEIEDHSPKLGNNCLLIMVHLSNFALLTSLQLQVI